MRFISRINDLSRLYIASTLNIRTIISLAINFKHLASFYSFFILRDK
jgi:hypothetical protein